MSYKYRILLISTEDMLGKILEDTKEFEVITVNGELLKSLQMLYRQSFDVLLLDMDNISVSDALIYIKRIPDNIKINIILCGTVSLSTETAQKLTQVGAKTFIRKPKKGKTEVGEFCLRISVAIVGFNRDLIESANTVEAKIAKITKTDNRHVIVIGASTGGTVALGKIFPDLSDDLPGIIIIQHMSQGFTKDFAQTLNRTTSIEVVEGEDGMAVLSGRAIIVPSNHCLAVAKIANKLIVKIMDRDPKSIYNPNIDYTMKSVATTIGKDALGVILTGMGDDGARGIKALYDCGARTIAQDEQSSVVYGMPRKAVEYGGVSEVLPLDKIAKAINVWGQKLQIK